MHAQRFKKVFATLALTIALIFSLTAAVRVEAASETLSESQKVEQLEQLISQLIALLKQLYPQIDWSAFETDDDESEDSDEDEDEDEEDEKPDVDDPTAEQSGDNGAQVEYVIPFALHAFGEEMYLPTGADRGAVVSTDVGVTYVIEDGEGDAYAGGTALASFDGSGEAGDTNDYFRLDDDWRVFTLSISFNNEGGTIGYYRARIVGITFDEDTTAGGEETLTTGLKDYETPVIYVGDTE